MTSRRTVLSLVAVTAVLLPTAAVTAQSEGPCVKPPPDVVAWWPGDDCTPYDLLEQHDGTFEGGPFCPIDWKVGGNALGFQTDPLTYVIVPHHTDLEPGSGDFTIDLWILTSAVADYHPLLEKLDGSGYQFGLRFDGVPQFIVCDDLICMLASGTNPVNDGDWHHLAATLKRVAGGPDELKVYVDGELSGSSSTELGTIACADDLLIGAAPSHGQPTVAFSGVMDEIEIYDRALSETEIRMIWAADSFGKCKDLCPGDINNDGVVNVLDFLELLSYWGPCP
jgi:hypothetical protein